MCIQAIPIVTGFAGSLMQSRQQVAQSRYQAALARRDAAITQQAGALERAEMRRRAQQELGQNRVRINGRGVAMSGSALEHLQQQAMDAEYEIAKHSWQNRLQMDQYRMSSQQHRKKAKDATRQGYFSAASFLLNQW